jgi:hypothetical protein
MDIMARQNLCAKESSRRRAAAFFCLAIVLLETLIPSSTSLPLAILVTLSLPQVEEQNYTANPSLTCFLAATSSGMVKLAACSAQRGGLYPTAHSNACVTSASTRRFTRSAADWEGFVSMVKSRVVAYSLLARNGVRVLSPLSG